MNTAIPVFDPFYFPTKVAIIDDERECLSQIGLSLSDDYACDLYTSPIQALKSINYNQIDTVNLYQECSYQTNLEIDYENVDNNFFRFADDPKRFNKYSVVLVDYSMPEMDGLELCRNIKDAGVKKILITGKADMGIAIQAFNDGVIDFFVQKQNADFNSILNSTIKRLSHKYFKDLCSHSMFFVKKHAPYLFDDGFYERFQKICEMNDVAEYYLKRNILVSEFMLITKTGDVKYLLVQTEDQIKAQMEIAVEEESLMPEALFKLVCNREIIPYFAGRCVYESSYKDSWKNHVYKAEKYKTYIYSLIEAKDIPELALEIMPYSYKEFLNKFYMEH
ncbi:MAG: response regulator [Gammaproteobacteria bacterium]|nr:response regulator [Gammaproteobacteria bacterium]MDH5652977.1 response regulator [Gammaproteobacteria bacterium]